MSYDVSVGEESHNYTWNLRQFFTAFGIHPYHDMDGLRAQQVIWNIDHALQLIMSHDLDRLAEKYNAPNGWGDVFGAVRFLSDIRESCLRAGGKAIVRAT